MGIRRTTSEGRTCQNKCHQWSHGTTIWESRCLCINHSTTSYIFFCYPPLVCISTSIQTFKSFPMDNTMTAPPYINQNPLLNIGNSRLPSCVCSVHYAWKNSSRWVRDQHNLGYLRYTKNADCRTLSLFLRNSSSRMKLGCSLGNI